MEDQLNCPIVSAKASQVARVAVAFLAGLLVVGDEWLFEVRAQVQGASLVFTATDLTDTTPGQDLWEFKYSLSGLALSANQGFTVMFDRTLFGLLQDPPPAAKADWNVLAVQPDLFLGSDGFYDALAVRDTPSVTDPFAVQFVWFGPGTPGPQPFIVYDANFLPLLAGQTESLPPPGPTLLAELRANQIVLCWKTDAVLYHLESTRDLGNSIWQATDSVVSFKGGSNSVSIALTNQRTFYRLAR